MATAMPFVGSSGRKLYVDGPGPSSATTKKFAYAVLVVSICLSFVALVRLGAAASAAVAAVSAGGHAAVTEVLPANASSPT